MADQRLQESERASGYRRRAVALPLATADRTRCTHHRENGHRCALTAAHASEHFYRENGVRWRGDKSSGLTQEETNE